MRALLKQVFAKDSDLNWRLTNFTRAFYLRHDMLLIGSVGIFALAVFGWSISHFVILRDFGATVFTLVLLFSPVFVVLAIMDILKSGLTRNRIIALVCSAVAVGLVAARVYIVIHPNYDA